MSLLDKFLLNFRSGKKPATHSDSGHEGIPLLFKTPYGDVNLARPEGRAKFRSIVTEIHRSTDALTRKDIADWRAAWQMALNVDSPDRRRLYDIYRDVDADLHLTG